MDNCKFKLFQVLIIISTMIISSQTISASYSFEENVYISSILKDEYGTPTRIGVVILNEDESLEFDLEFSYKYNNEILNRKCSHNIIFEDNLKYQKKVYCDIPKQEENGMYTAIIKLSNPTSNEELYMINETFFYDSKESYALLSFQENDRGTQVTIDLSNENISDDTTIYHDIPREVINSITPENKDLVIDSDKEFKIIEQNPIISWNVDSRDERIEYIILNKSVDESLKKQFQTYPSENDSITTVVIFSIVVLLIIIFLPLLKNIRNKKSNNL